MQSIYLHFPFCERKCAYCDFVSFKCDGNIKKQYVEKLIEEIDRKAATYSIDEVSSIYFGGGTPTCVETELLCEVLNCIKQKFIIKENAEITIEGNPATFDENSLFTLKNAGFNRFSVGVQSFVDVELLSVERLHNGQQAEKACREVSKYFPNYSLDLMLGLPNQTIDSLKFSIEKAISLNPQHISCYMLKVEQNTPLEKYVKEKKVFIPDDDTLADLYDYAVKVFEENGFMQYETSNFAKENFHSRHNMAYWQLQNYLGLGISAHSLVGQKRFYNDSDLKKYISHGEKELVEEILDINDLEKEFIMLSLRLNRGIDLHAYKEKFKEDFALKYANTLEKMRNYINRSSDFVSIKQKHFSVASSIIIEFM